MRRGAATSTPANSPCRGASTSTPTNVVVRVIAAVALWLAIGCAAARADVPHPDGLSLVDRLGTTDRAEFARVVTEIERARLDTPDLDEALFAAARACEDSLADPARALALYDRLLAEFPDARRSSAARTRAELLRAKMGTRGSYAREATELAQLVAEADRLPDADIEARAERLATAPWPGAPDAALWLAEWLRRTRRFDEAQARYADVVRRWPNTPQAWAALRGGAGNAIDNRDWDLAEALANQLPVEQAIDAVLREELLGEAAKGRRRAWWYGVAWVALGLVVAGLVGSLAEALLRTRARHAANTDPRDPSDKPSVEPHEPPGKQHDPSEPQGPSDQPRDPPDEPRKTLTALAPPIEVVFLIPVAAVLVGVALTTHELIAPAVFWLAVAGISMTWISGVTLETLRVHGRVVRSRAIAHATACVVGIAATLYILLVRDNLLDMLIETMRFGPSG